MDLLTFVQENVNGMVITAVAGLISTMFGAYVNQTKNFKNLILDIRSKHADEMKQLRQKHSDDIRNLDYKIDKCEHERMELIIEMNKLKDEIAHLKRINVSFDSMLQRHLAEKREVLRPPKKT